MDARRARPVRGAWGRTGGRRWVLGAAALLSLALVGACSGGEGDPAASSSPDVAESSAPPSTTAPAPVRAARDFSRSSGVVIAHRGASAAAPEHTFAAFDRALADGADYLEIDVQLTSDGVPVVLHDATLDRTVRGPADRCAGPVAARTVEDLGTCDAGAWFGEVNPGLGEEEFVGQPVPTLAGVLDRYGPEVRYYIEIKSPDEQPGLEAALLAVLSAAELDAGDGTLPPLVIQSFSGDSLRRLHEQRPELPLVQLIAPGVVLDGAALDRVAAYAVAVGPNKADVDAGWIAAANARCLDVHPWTVNSIEDMERFAEAGAGAQFTNHPERLVGVTASGPDRPELCASPAVGGT